MGFLVLLTLLAATKGGRTFTGLLFYDVTTLFLFYKSSNPFYKTKLDRPLLGFLSIATVSGLYSIVTHRLGFLFLTTLYMHALNFYLFYSLRDETFYDRYLKWIEGIGMVFVLILFIFQFQELDVKNIFPNENLLSAVLNCGLLISIARLQDKDRYSLIGVFPTILFLMSQLLLSSRGGIIALSSTLFLYLALNWKKALRPLEIFLGFILLCLALWPQSLRDVCNSFLNPLGYSRTIIWKGALQTILARPWTGWGLGNFGNAYQQYKLPVEFEIGRFEKTTNFAHNEFLDVFAQMGMVGFIVYCWLIFLIFYSALKTLKNNPNNWKKIAASLCLISLTVHSFFDFIFHLPMLLFLFLTFSALILEEGTQTFPSLTAIKKLTLPAFFLMGTLFASYILKNIPAEHSRALLIWAHRLNPYDIDIIEKLATIEKNEEKKWLLKGIKTHPTQEGLYAKMAKIYIREGKIEDGISMLQKATSLNPKFPFYYSELADIYVSLGNFSKAAELYKTAIALEPIYREAHYKLGTLYFKIGDMEKAKIFLENAAKIEKAKIHSDSPYVRHLLGIEVKKSL